MSNPLTEAQLKELSREIGIAIGSMIPVISQFPALDKDTAVITLEALNFASKDPMPPYATACYEGAKFFLNHFIHNVQSPKL